MKNLILACAALAFAVACGGGGGGGGGAEKSAQYPAQPEGCAVEVFREAPPHPTDNIGPVSSSCDEHLSDEECLRTMLDEACRLGANVVWGVEPSPTIELGKKKYAGRAAHTK